MKRILLIAPDSYPVKGAESIVNIKLLKALSKSNEIEIDLISKKDKQQNYPSDSLADLGIKLRSIHVLEVDNKINLSTIYQHIVSFFLFGIAFKGSHWAVKAVRLAKQLIKLNDYDVVITKNRAAPLVGYYLKKHYGLKWVVTCNDPTPEEMYPQPYGHGINGQRSRKTKRLISILSKYGDKFIFPNERLRDYMLQYLFVPLTNTVIIPHVVNEMPIQQKKLHGPLKLIHSGNLSLPRSPRTFFVALSTFIKKHPDFPINVSLLGVGNKNIQQEIDELKLNNYISLIPPVSYITSLEILRDYDIAIIIEADCKEGIFLPTKVSDFMQNRKRILAISPRVGVLNDLYKSGDIDYFANVSSSNDIIDTLEQIYSDFNSGKIRNTEYKIKKNYMEDFIINSYLSL